GMHGVDWDAVLDRYLPMVQDAVTREDVSYIIREMISELNVGHAYYREGRLESQPFENVGMLAVDFALHTDDEGNEAYMIERFYEGGPHEVDMRNPLRMPGMDIHEGTYLHAVNGIPMDTSKDPWAAFQGTVGNTVILTVSDSPVWDSEEAREVMVEPHGTGREYELRFRAWIEANRQYVYEQSDGQIGYIYVTNTAVDGHNDLVRQFFGQRHMPALMIDERWNGGGFLPHRLIEVLDRPLRNYWALRDSTSWTSPQDGHFGPKAMLINGMAGSGGDMFPALFRQHGLGKLVGTRTWGGLVGITGMPAMIDGSSVSVPNFAYYEQDGTWGIEGHGVDPDIEVIDDPALMVNGGDPQIDAAIEQLLRELETGRFVPTPKPAGPDRSGFGIADEDR
ncbi:MAG: S41 family peptidase, partial [Planctomycetota bacterium]